MFVLIGCLLATSVWGVEVGLKEKKQRGIQVSLNKKEQKRGGLSSKVATKTKDGSGLKVEGASHQVMKGMAKLSTTLQKLRTSVNDGPHELTEDARIQFMSVAEAAMKMEDKMQGQGGETSEQFRDILFKAQLLLELMEYKQTGRIDVDTVTNLAEAESHMFQERSYAENDKLQEHIGDILDDVDFDVTPMGTNFGGGGYGYDDEYFEQGRDGFMDEISVTRKQEFLKDAGETWNRLEPLLTAKGFTPDRIGTIKKHFYWWVHPLDHLMLIQHAAATATILNFTSEVGTFLASKNYIKSLDDAKAKKARSTGLSLKVLGESWFKATSVNQFTMVKNSLAQLRPDIVEVSKNVPKDLDPTQLHLPTLSDDEENFEEAFTGGLGMIKLKEEFQEELAMPEDSKVKSAWYGDLMHIKGIDVTTKVKARLDAGENVVASNDLFGDPVPGTGKMLYVEYDREDITTDECSEEFSDEITGVKAESVISAFYGSKDKDRGIDVTDKVRAILKRRDPLNASYEVFGDPVFGVGKWLYVTYNQRLQAVDALLEGKVYSMELILDAAQHTRAGGVPIFVPDIMNALMQGVSQIQYLKEADLVKKVAAPDGASSSGYFSWGMSLRDIVSNIVTPGRRNFIPDEV